MALHNIPDAPKATSGSDPSVYVREIGTSDAWGASEEKLEFRSEAMDDDTMESSKQDDPKDVVEKKTEQPGMSLGEEPQYIATEGSEKTEAPVVLGSKPAQRLPKTFPFKLHELLLDEDFQEIICWLPDGDSFVIRSRERLVKEVLPKYFKEAKFLSFTRKLNRWGFRRTFSDLYPNEIVFFHRLFIRDSPDLCKGMSGARYQNRKFPTVQNPDIIHGISGGNQAVIYGLHPMVAPTPQTLQQLPGSLTPLERHLLERQFSSSLDIQGSALGQVNSRLRQVQTLRAELDARRRAAALLQIPVGLPTALQTRGLGSYDLRADTTSTLEQVQRNRDIAEALEFEALLLRQRQVQRNDRFFRAIRPDK